MAGSRHSLQLRSIRKCNLIYPTTFGRGHTFHVAVREIFGRSLEPLESTILLMIFESGTREFSLGNPIAGLSFSYSPFSHAGTAAARGLDCGTSQASLDGREVCACD